MIERACVAPLRWRRQPLGKPGHPPGRVNTLVLGPKQELDNREDLCVAVAEEKSLANKELRGPRLA